MKIKEKMVILEELVIACGGEVIYVEIIKALRKLEDDDDDR